MAKEQEEKKPRRRVKKVAGHGGHHGGAWKVAYADFVTAMMALFLVLWLVSQADMKLKQGIANYFRSPGVFTTMKGGILPGPQKVSKDPEDLTFKDDEEALFSVAQVLRKQFESRKELAAVKERVKIEVTEEGLRIQILDKADKISFPSGSAELANESKMILGEIARAVCTLPNPILIGGHTDSHVFPSENGYTNWELSADRANAARRALTSECVKPEQIRKIVGYADTEPIVPNDPYAPANRRISITVMRLKNKDGSDVETSTQTLSQKLDEAASKTPEKSEAPTPTSSPSKETSRKVQPATPAETSTPTNEKHTAKTKLEQEGKISVGEPDEIPAGIRKTTETPGRSSRN